MDRVLRSELPLLPLVLWNTPPGLELILGQDGIAFTKVRDAHPLAFRGGRFVLYDGRRVSKAHLRSMLSPHHVAIDVDVLRRDEPVDPFVALIDTEAAPAIWRYQGLNLRERVARYPRSAIRVRLLRRLRESIHRAGGIWARLAIYPYPYRSAFHFRADLDERYPDDYARFARARRPLDDCTTHFVSTHAYGQEPAVLEDLKRIDAQSHGHFHVVYRDEAQNVRNIERAHEMLVDAGINPIGFAAPEGRWNPGLDRALEGMGYLYSSDFQLGYDDVPFFPWRGDRFSNVLQVPIHPVCEGLFLNAGADRPRRIAHYLRTVVRAKIDAGEPAFVYGHPERRLGRFPDVLTDLAREIERDLFLWRVTLTEFARWWHWRADRRWQVVLKSDRRPEVQFDDWDTAYPLGLEIVRGDHSALLPVPGPRLPLRLEGLAYERRRVRGGPAGAEDRATAPRAQIGRPRRAGLGDRHPGRGLAGGIAARVLEEAAAALAVQPTFGRRRAVVRLPLAVRSRGDRAARQRVVLACRSLSGADDGWVRAPARPLGGLPGARWGENQLLQTARHLEARGVAVRPFCPWTDRLERARLLHLFGMSREGLALARVAKARRVPVVLSTICWVEPRALAALATTSSQRVLDLAKWSVRRFGPKRLGWRAELLSLADGILPNSEAEGRQLVRLFGADPRRIIVVPNGVEPRFARADPSAFHERHGTGDNVLYVGRVEPRKNVLGLIRAARRAGRPLVVIGDMVPGHEAYGDACRREGQGVLRWLPRIAHDDPLLASAYAAARVFALPSWFETPGLAALEAALAGCPVVLTPFGCTREYFGDRVRYARPDRPAEIARAIATAWASGPHPDLATHVERHYLWSAVARETSEAYDRVAS